MINNQIQYNTSCELLPSHFIIFQDTCSKIMKPRHKNIVIFYIIFVYKKTSNSTTLINAPLNDLWLNWIAGVSEWNTFSSKTV